MGLRWGVQGVDRASKTRGRAPVGSVRLAVPRRHAGIRISTGWRVSKFTCTQAVPIREIHRSTVASLERSKYPGLQAPLGSLRGRSPATTCRHTRADCRARLRQTILLPAHPLCSIRRSQDHGVSRPIASPAWQLLGLAVLHPCTSLVRSRHPAASELASESHLRSPGGISGPADHPARGTRASSRRSRILMHNIARS
jgi:hypothetical protein